MYYISSYNKKLGYGIMDTTDNVTEYYFPEDIKRLFSNVQIQGVEEDRIFVVDANDLVLDLVEEYKQSFKQLVGSYSVEDCEFLAKKCSFVRKLKEANGVGDKVREITFDNLYTSKIEDVVKTAAKYTNTYIPVDTTDEKVVRDALATSMCLVVARSVSGSMTAFIGTCRLSLMDKIYGDHVFDLLFLTKTLESRKKEMNLEKVRKKANRTEGLIDVCSGSLRFRAKSAKSEVEILEISSPMYSTLPGNIELLYKLDSPASMENLLMSKYFKDYVQGHVDNYDFDSKLYQCLLRDLEQGAGCVENVKALLFSEHIAEHAVKLLAIYKKKLDYISYIRARDCTFKGVD